MDIILNARRAMLVWTILSGGRAAAVHANGAPPPHPNAAVTDLVAISNENAGSLVLLRAFRGHDRRILDLTVSSRGEFIASSSEDMKIKVWDVGNAREPRAFPMTSVDMADIDVTSDGRMLASGEAIWDLESMQEAHALERGSQMPALVAFSPDGSLLALSRFDQETRLWDVASGRPVAVLPEGDEHRTKRMEFSPDGTLLAAGVIDGSVRVWDVQNRKLVQVLKHSRETDIHDIAFSPDGNLLASGGRVPAVILWDVRSGEVARMFSVRDDVYSVAFSPGGALLAAAGGYEEAVLLWDVQSGRLLRSLPLERKSMAIAFSPDGRFLVAGCFDGQILLWGIPAKTSGESLE